jgi:hypothetical protein
MLLYMKLNYEVCVAEYEVESQDYIIRDKDSIEYKFCGHTLIKWNAAVIYSAKKISKINK